MRPCASAWYPLSIVFGLFTPRPPAGGFVGGSGFVGRSGFVGFAGADEADEGDEGGEGGEGGGGGEGGEGGGEGGGGEGGEGGGLVTCVRARPLGGGGYPTSGSLRKVFVILPRAVMMGDGLYAATNSTGSCLQQLYHSFRELRFIREKTQQRNKTMTGGESSMRSFLTPTRYTLSRRRLPLVCIRLHLRIFRVSRQFRCLLLAMPTTRLPRRLQRWITIAK